MKALLIKIGLYLNRHRGAVIIVTACLLLVLVSVVQFFYTRRMFENELGKRAESELTTKAIIIRGMLNTMEKTLEEHLWDVERHIDHPDSMIEATKRIIMVNQNVISSALAFVPNYYPEKGRLFEPYAIKEGDNIRSGNMAEDGKHDYTTHPAVIKMMEEDKPSWSDPYVFEVNEHTTIPLTTYSYPLHDDQGRIIAICGLDISLKWLGDTLNTRHLYPSSFVVLMTEGGELISRPHSENIMESDVNQVVRLINDSTVERFPTQSGRSKGIRFHNSSGKGASVYYANMKGMPHWQIAVVCYDNEVYQKLRWLGFNMLVLLLLVLGILGFIIHRFFLNERRLSVAKADKERIGNELRIATGIQNAMLAQDAEVANHPDIMVGATLKPAREVGGDLYNYFVRYEKLFFCVGDVSGKGIPSALIMAMTQALFRAVSSHENNPAHIMKTINETACRNNKANMFATLFIGVLDLPSGRLRFCNAGHDTPIVMDANGVNLLPVKANLPAGLFDDFEYEIEETVIRKGTTLFLYTDGLTEARNTSRKQFGLQRVMDALNQRRDDTPEEIITFMTEQVQAFAGEEEQSDDLTMLAIRYAPQTEDFTSHGELTLKNDVGEVKHLHAFLKTLADELHLDTSMTRNIRLAVEEAVVNVMDYAYPAGKEGNVNIKALSNRDSLKIVITDTGAAFNPTEAAQADTSLSAEDRPIGGLGILLVRELMDSINYERSDGQNILTLIKQL